MKKYIFLTAALMALVIFAGCTEKQRPVLQINNESVTSIEFKKTCYSDEDPDSRSYVSKTVTELTKTSLSMSCFSNILGKNVVPR